MLHRPYVPNPDHVNIMPSGVADPASENGFAPWYIELSSDCTVVELALLMTRYGCHAQVITASQLRLVPRERNLPCPTAVGVAELFQFGLEALRLGRFRPIQLAHSAVPQR